MAVRRVQRVPPPPYVFRVTATPGCVHPRHCTLQLLDTTPRSLDARVVWKPFHPPGDKMAGMVDPKPPQEDVCHESEVSA